LIELRDIRVRFDRAEILRGVNLEAATGEAVALIGESGSGKTTLLKTAVGLIRPAAGEVRIAGENLTRASSRGLAHVRRQVGMLFQGNALFDSMTVRENVGFVLQEVQRLAPAEIERRVRELLLRLHLGEIGGLYPRQLSGGMKKRVGLARAVIGEPKLLFCDDPTAGLDPITSDAIADLILALRRYFQVTLLLVSNSIPVVKKIADRVVLLHQGRLLDLGPSALIEDSNRPEVQRFLRPEAAP
jgi:phospholipid/cholesterol/gamma-HCH transport system ATP-binding protein